MSAAGRTRHGVSRRRLANGVAAARPAAHQRAFVVEAVLLTLFLAVSLAVVTAVFGGATALSGRAQDASVAVTLAGGGAENGLEDFAADPARAESWSVSGYAFEDGALRACSPDDPDAFVVERTVFAEETAAGVLYTAEVTVEHGGAEVYAASTSSYVSGREG